MTVKDLKLMLQFYPENAEILIQDKTGSLSCPQHMLEGMIEYKPNTVVMTVIETELKLKVV